MPHRRDVIAAVGAGTILATGVAGAQEETGDDDGDEPADPTGQHLAILTGDAEVPSVETDATGTASVVVDRHRNVHYSLAVAGIENVTMAHIHAAQPGENGPVVQWLHPGAEPTQEPQLLQGQFSGVLHHGSFSANDFVGPLEGESLDALLALVADGGAYVNVHTEEHPAGAIRGQLHPLGDVLAQLGMADTDGDDDDNGDDADDVGDDDTDDGGDGDDNGTDDDGDDADGSGGDDADGSGDDDADDLYE